jgi:hypothetical protein
LPRLDLDPGASGAMTSPLLRLFAVFWWLLVIGSAAVACFGVWLIVESHRPNTGYPNADYAGSFYLAFSLCCSPP